MDQAKDFAFYRSNSGKHRGENKISHSGRKRLSIDRSILQNRVDYPLKFAN